MKIEQCEKRNKEIINNALLWAMYKDCTPLEQLDVAIIAEYLGMNLPKAFYNFIEAKSPYNFNAYGSYKTIANTLEKNACKIIK